MPDLIASSAPAVPAGFRTGPDGLVLPIESSRTRVRWTAAQVRRIDLAVKLLKKEKIQFAFRCATCEQPMSVMTSRSVATTMRVWRCHCTDRYLTRT